MPSEKEAILSQRVAVLEAENKIIRAHSNGVTIGRIVTQFFKWGGLVSIFYLVKESIVALAGHDTFADISIVGIFSGTITSGAEPAPVSLLADIRVLVALSILFGSAGILFGAWQNKLKKDIIEKYHQYQVEFEKMSDSKRSSSKLSTRGDTRKEDK